MGTLLMYAQKTYSQCQASVERRVPAQRPTRVRHFALATGNLSLAGSQFLKDTAWAVTGYEYSTMRNNATLNRLDIVAIGL